MTVSIAGHGMAYTLLITARILHVKFAQHLDTVEPVRCYPVQSDVSEVTVVLTSLGAHPDREEFALESLGWLKVDDDPAGSSSRLDANDGLAFEQLVCTLCQFNCLLLTLGLLCCRLVLRHSPAATSASALAAP